MDLNARNNVNFARVDVNFQTVTVTLFCYNIFSFFFQLRLRSHLHSIQNFSQIYSAILEKGT